MSYDTPIMIDTGGEYLDKMRREGGMKNQPEILSCEPCGFVWETRHRVCPVCGGLLTDPLGAIGEVERLRAINAELATILKRLDLGTENIAEDIMSDVREAISKVEGEE